LFKRTVVECVSRARQAAVTRQLTRCHTNVNTANKVRKSIKVFSHDVGLVRKV
jgi:hypothetical protein